MSANPQCSPTLTAKTVTAITVAVLALHALVGVALMFMPSVPLTTVTVTPPLEVKFVSPPKLITPPADPLPPKQAQLPKPVQPLTPDITPTEPTAPIQTADEKPKPAKALLPTDSKPPVAADKAPQAASKAPPVKPLTTRPTPSAHTSLEPTVSKTVAEPSTYNNTPVAPLEPIRADTQVANTPTERFNPTADQQKSENAQREQGERKTSEREASETAQREQAQKARWTQEQQAQAQRDAAESAKAAQVQAAQAAAEQERAARQKAEQEQQARQAREIDRNKDYSGKIQWKNRPNIKLTPNLSEMGKRKNITDMTVRVSFSTSGGVTDVAIIKSSGDSQIDLYLQRQVMRGKVYPYTVNGRAVAGTFIQPIDIDYKK